MVSEEKVWKEVIDKVKWKQKWACFLLFVYICNRWRFNYQEGRVRILLTGLTLSHFCACPKPEPDFQCCMSWWEVILYFGDNGGMVGHHCCNFLFIIPVFLMYFYHVHLHSLFFLWPVIAMTIFVASHCYGNCMFPVIAMIIVCDQSLQWQFLWPVILLQLYVTSHY